MGRLDGKVCIITGSNSGVGAAAAELFAKEGAKVVITARRQDKLDEEANKIRSMGGTVLAVKCDVSNEEEVIALVKKVVDTFDFSSRYMAVVPCKYSCSMSHDGGSHFHQLWHFALLGLFYPVEQYVLRFIPVYLCPDFPELFHYRPC